MFRRVFASPFSSLHGSPAAANSSTASSSSSTASSSSSSSAPASPLPNALPPHAHSHTQHHNLGRNPHSGPSTAATAAAVPTHRRQSSTPVTATKTHSLPLSQSTAQSPAVLATDTNDDSRRSQAGAHTANGLHQPSSASSSSPSSSAGSPSDLLSVLQSGSLFKKHEWNGRGSGVLSLDVFMWLVGEGRASTLYWCSAFVASARPQLERQSLPLRSVTDFMLSKKTDVLRATKAEERRCFALIASTGQSLHMEAPSVSAALLWKEGLMACLSSTGKQIKRISHGGGGAKPAVPLTPATPNSAVAHSLTDASSSAPSTPLTPAGQPTSEPITPTRPLPYLLSAASQATLPAPLVQSPSSASSFNTVDLSLSPDLSSLSSSASLSSLCVSPPLSVLVGGSAFRIYYINSRSVPSVTDVFLFLTLEQASPSAAELSSSAAFSASSSSSSAAAAGAVSGNSGSGSVPCLYWCPVSSSSVRKRVVSQRLLVSSIVKLSVGKETSILRHSVAATAVAEHCLSIIGRALSLNLEATNVQTRVQWQTGLTLLMQHLQLRYELGNTPPSEPLLIQPSPMSPRSADLGPASPLHRSASSSDGQPPPSPSPDLSYEPFVDADSLSALPSSDPRHPRHSGGGRPNPIDTSMPRHTPEPSSSSSDHTATVDRTTADQHSAFTPSQHFSHTPAPASSGPHSSASAAAFHTPLRSQQPSLEPPYQVHTPSSASISSTRQSPAPPSPVSDSSARFPLPAGASNSNSASASGQPLSGSIIFPQPPLPFTLWIVTARPQQAHTDEVHSSAVSVHVSDAHLCYSEVLLAPSASRAAVAASHSLPLSSITQLSTSRDLPLSLASRLHSDRLLLVFTSSGCLTLEGRSVEVRDALFKQLHTSLVQAGRKAQHIIPNTLSNSHGASSTAVAASSSSSTAVESAPLPSVASQAAVLPPSASSHQRSRSADLQSISARLIDSASATSQPAAAAASSSMSLAAAVAYLAQGQLVSRYAESVEGNGHNSVHRVPIMLYTSTAATRQQPAAVTSPLSPPAAPLLAASSFHLCWCAPPAFASSSGPPAPTALNSLSMEYVTAVMPNREAGLLRSLLIKASPDRCIAVLTASQGNLFIEAQSREQRDRLHHALLAVLIHVTRHQQLPTDASQVAVASSPSLSSTSTSGSTRSPSSVSSSLSVPPSPSMADRGDNGPSPSPRRLSVAATASTTSPLSSVASSASVASTSLPSTSASSSSSSSSQSASSSSSLSSSGSSSSSSSPSPSSSTSAVSLPSPSSSLPSSSSQSDFRQALSLLCAGQHFNLYVLVPSARRSDLPPHSASPASSSSSSAAGSVACRAVLVWFESALGDETPGSLYWCPAGSRVLDKSCRLQLNRTKRMALGRESSVWQAPVAVKVPANRCLSITAADGQTLHLEAPSGEIRDAWQKSLHLLLIRNGLQAVESRQQQPVVQRESGGKSLPLLGTAHTPHSAAAGQPTQQSEKVRQAVVSAPLPSTAATEKDREANELKVAQPAQQPPHITAAAVRRPAPSPPLQPTWHEDDDSEHRPALPAAPTLTLTALALSEPPPLPPPPSAADLLPLSVSSSSSSAASALPSNSPSAAAAPMSVPGGSRVLPLPSPSRSSSVSRTIQFSDPTEWFLLQSKIGEGSYGSVYRALDVRDDSLVAIKVLPFDGRDNSRASLKLRKEIKILRRCESPYIVGYRGAFQKGSSVWIVMDFCAGGSLSDVMHCCSHTFSERQVGAIMKMALHGLAALHRVGVIHRDIKGGNILADSSGVCKLADFGVSSTINSSLGRQRTVIGTPHWMAPEVLLSDEYNELADVWSLGITAYELAVGEPPHAKLHSMRAAVKIPQSAPPTLPDPDTWSSDFHSFLAACLPEHDTRVLTNYGFLFLADIERRSTAGEPVLYACYESSTQSIVYRAGQLVLAAPPTRWVDFTQAGTRRLWDATSDDYGSTVSARGAMASRLTLRTTPEHDMYVQPCMQSTGGTSSGRVSGGAHIPPHKMTARELAPGYQCDCDAVGRTCTHGYSHYRMYTGAASGLQTFADVISHTNRSDRRSPVAVLGLNAKDELDAFLELFGYWLGEGTMSYDTRADLASNDAVCFEARQNQDRVYLLSLLARLHLVRGQHFTINDSDTLLEVCITEPRWFRFFDAEFGVAYSNSRHYDRRLALPKQGMHSTQRRPSTSTASTVSACATIPSTGARSLSASVSVELVADCSGDGDTEDMLPCEADSVEDDCVASDKWLPEWTLFRLDAEQLRLVIEGLRRAAGRSATAAQQHSAAVGGKVMQAEQQICMSSVGFRDQLVHACLHAGYSAYFTVNIAAGELRGYYAVANDDCPYSEEEMEAALRVDSTRQFKPVRGQHDSWWVCYSEAISELLPAHDVRFDGSACSVRQKESSSQVWVAINAVDGSVRQEPSMKKLAQLLSRTAPSINKTRKKGFKVGGAWRVFSTAEYEAQQSGQAMQQQQAASVATLPSDLYDWERDGRTWCVSVDHPDALIFVQRAHRDDRGVVSKVGRAVIAGNCLVKDPLKRPSAELLLHHPFIGRAAEPTVLVPMIAQREREADNTHRKANNIGSGGSLDSMEDAPTAPLSKAITQPQPLQPPQSRTALALPHHELAAVSRPTSDSSDGTGTAESQRTQIRNLDNFDRTHEHWNNTDDERSQSSDSQQQQQQMDDTHTRTLPHSLLPADIDTSPPRRLHKTGSPQQPQSQQSQPQHGEQQHKPERTLEQPSEHLVYQQQQQQQQHSAVQPHGPPLIATLRRSSNSSPALSQQPTEAFNPLSQLPSSAAAAIALTAARHDSTADSSRQHSTSSSSPSSWSSPSHVESNTSELPLSADWSETGSRRTDSRSGSAIRIALHEKQQFEPTPLAAWPTTETTPI